MGPTSRGGAVARLLLASVDAELDTSGAAFAMSVMQQPSFETVQSRCTSASLEVLHLRRCRSELSDVGARASDGPCQAAPLRSAPYRDDAAVGANLIRPDSSHSRQHRIEASSEFCRRFPASDAGALRRASGQRVVGASIGPLRRSGCGAAAERAGLSTSRRECWTPRHIRSRQL